MNDTPIQRTCLWRSAFEDENYLDDRAAADRLRQGIIDMRAKARILATEIGRDLPEFTGHDIDHMDALWEIADVLAGEELEFNPAAAFVFGAAVLVHDIAMSRASYIIGGKGIREQAEWPDRLAHKLREQNGRAPHPSELVQPPEEIAKAAEAELLRDLHARQAEIMPLGHWCGLDGSTQYLIADADLRSTFGRLIGRLAASHHWDRDILAREFSNLVGAPAFAPGAWKVDSLLIACLLRTADAAHLDAARAPELLAAVRGLSDGSRQHWVFQNKMARPYLDKGKLVFTAPAGFDDSEIDSWWLAFDTLRMVDEELRGVDRILSENGRLSLSATGVAGASSPREFSQLVKCLEWEPVDTRVQVGDVAQLVRRLGGEELYGPNVFAAIREILVNACDAVKARKSLQQYRGGRAVTSYVSLALRGTRHERWLEVSDNGIGMSPEVLSGPLLDFGCSSWLSNTVARENPGLVASRFIPTGRFGIGFFSVFMLGNHVEVISRSLSAGRESTWVLQFGDGLNGRPILRVAKPAEVLEEPGTTIRVLLAESILDAHGGLPFVASNPLDSSRFIQAKTNDVAQIVRYILPTAEANVWVWDDASSEFSQVMAENDWLSVGGECLLARVLGGWSSVEEMKSGKADDTLVRLATHYSPMLQPILDTDGSVIARICAVDELAISEIGWAGWHASVVTAGAARTETGVFGVVGLMLGKPTRASRDAAIPIVAPERISEWASSEVTKALDRGLERQTWWWVETFAEAMRVLGGDYAKLPFWQVDQGRLNEDELRCWLRERDRVIEVHPANMSVNLGLRTIYAAPVSDTIWFEDGSRPALHNATRRWPLPDSDNTHNPGTLLETALAEAWGFPLEVVRTFRRRTKARALEVAKYEGKPIIGDAKEFARNELCEFASSDS